MWSVRKRGVVVIKERALWRGKRVDDRELVQGYRAFGEGEDALYLENKDCIDVDIDVGSKNKIVGWRNR